MNKNIIALLMFLFCSKIAFAQHADVRIMDLIYKDIKQQNEHYQLKQSLTGTELIADPVSGEEYVSFPSNVSADTRVKFNSFSKAEQGQILRSDILAVNPLRDTLYIIDSLRFFSEQVFALEGEKIKIKIIRSGPQKLRQGYIRLYAAGIWGDNLIFSFIIGNGLLRNYYFSMERSAITLQKTKNIEQKHTME